MSVGQHAVDDGVGDIVRVKNGKQQGKSETSNFLY